MKRVSSISGAFEEQCGCQGGASQLPGEDSSRNPDPAAVFSGRLALHDAALHVVPLYRRDVGSVTAPV